MCHHTEKSPKSEGDCLKQANALRCMRMDAIENRKARHEYAILDTVDAGLVLQGQEVKSIRGGKASLAGAYVKIYNHEAWLINAHISPYQEKNTPTSYDPLRSRKVLLHAHQIADLLAQTQGKGLTLIPLLLYNKNGHIKLSLGLAQGKKAPDKRASIKEREVKRSINQTLKFR